MVDRRTHTRFEVRNRVDVSYHVDGWEYVDRIVEAGVDGFVAHCSSLKDAPKVETVHTFSVVGVQVHGQIGRVDPLASGGARYDVSTFESESWRTRVYPELIMARTTSPQWWDRLLKFSPVVIMAIVVWAISVHVNDQKQQIEISNLKQEVANIRSLQTDQARLEEKIDGIAEQIREIRRTMEDERNR